jgi:hypothetical protein
MKVKKIPQGFALRMFIEPPQSAQTRQARKFCGGLLNPTANKGRHNTGKAHSVIEHKFEAG